MKKLLVFLIILALPPVLVYVAFTNPNPPVFAHEYQTGDPQTIIQDEITLLLMREETHSVAIARSEGALNDLIFNLFRESAPDYLPPNQCESADCRYAISMDTEVLNQTVEGGVVAVWIVLEEEALTLFIQVEAHALLAFPTLLSLRFNVENSEETLTLSFERATLGRVRLSEAMVSPIVTRLMDRLGNTSDQTFGDAITLSVSDLSVRLDKTALTNNDDLDPRLATLFLEEDIPYSIWVFLLSYALLS